MANIDNQWPEQDLESVSHCPVCGQCERTILHTGLQDYAFRAAEGKWNMYKCANCGIAYLDPRPTQSSIWRAYSNYYTHETPISLTNSSKNKFRILMRSLLNGYINSHYKLKIKPDLYIGRWLVPLIAPLRSKADCELRHIPKNNGPTMRLLDVGCGNGGYMQLARKAGWDVEGIDFDQEAVNAAGALGLTVYVGGIDVLSNIREKYDVITLSHVIEHVYDPVGLLRNIHRLLKPGGSLWIETPNINSRLSLKYGKNWRGLEPPRHLVLFTCEQLRKLLFTVGFSGVRQHWNRAAEWIEIHSQEIHLGRYDYEELAHKRLPLMRAMIGDAQEILRPAKREFITFVAHK